MYDDGNITIYMQPGSDIWRQEMFKLPYPYPELAEKFFNIPSSDDEFWNITKYQLLEKETYLQCLTYCNLSVSLSFTKLH